MSNGRFRFYYWQIYSFLSELLPILDTSHSDYSFPHEDELEFTGEMRAALVFKDGSRLFVKSLLDDTADLREYDYAYIYLDAKGQRIFQYDDAPHHPELSTHPHHWHRGKRPAKGEDKARALDMPKVDFVAVVSKIRKEYFEEE